MSSGSSVWTVLSFLAVRHLRQVDDHADVRVAEGAQQIARVRRRIVPAENDDTRQRLEGPIIAFRIDHAHAVPLKDRLLAHQARQPRFAGARLTGDQNRPAAHGEADLAAIVLMPELETPSAHLAGGQARLP